MEAVIRRPNQGEQLTNPLGARVIIRVTGAETGGRYTLIEAEQPADGPPAPLHIHHKEDEAIQVLEGQLIVEVDGMEHSLIAGSYILIPKGLAQRFWNPGPGPCKYQAIFSPSGQEDYFRAAYSLDPEQPDYRSAIAKIREDAGLEYPNRLNDDAENNM